MLFRGYSLVAAFLLLCSASTLWAQDPFGGDDPFGGGNPFGAGDDAGDAAGGIFGGEIGGGVGAAPARPPQPGEEAQEEVDPLVLQLRRYAAGSPEQLGVAVREASRLRLWSELDTFLGTNRVENLSAAERVRVAETVGQALLTRAWTEATLGEEARESLRLLREAVATAAVDPATLDAAIRQLGSESYDERLGATRTLLQGGNAALAKLAAAAAAAEPPAPRQRIIKVLRGFGSSGFEAVAPLALYGDASVRTGALRTLAALDRERALAMLVTALHSRVASPAERELAAAILRQIFPSLPSRHEAELYLVDRLRVANEAYRRSRLGFAGAQIWQIDAAGTGVEPVVPTPTVATARRAVDFASMLQRLGSLHPSTLSAAVRAELRYRYLIDSIFGLEPADFAPLQTAWGEALTDATFLSRLLSDALGQPVGDSLAYTFDESLGDALGAPGRGGGVGPGETLDDPAAAIAILRWMAVVGDPDVVYTTAAEPAPLVAAASHPEPRVRYEAATTIGALAPRQPYEESNRVLDRWIEMSQLDDAPLALLMVNDALSARVLNAHLDQLGYRVVRVPSAEALVDAVAAGGDLQLIVATTTPPDMVAVEMVDRVRRLQLGGRVPILLVGEPTEALVTIGDRWLAPLQQIPLPQTVAAVAATLRPMNAAAPLPPLRAAERQGYALQGLAILESLAGEQGTPQPYDLLRREQALAEASQRSGFSSESLAVLSALGSPQSQSLLATLAANPSLDAELRQRAAEAFAASVERFGTRLSRRQVADQYERFNLERTPEGRAAIGRVLDAMEAKVGVSSQPPQTPPADSAPQPDPTPQPPAPQP
ncbi:hypothetical protein [Candidatus Laterigemmans baculatus]|nr:hypothetical protein [Candidatus Laterigemmans baculatus]